MLLPDTATLKNDYKDLSLRERGFLNARLQVGSQKPWAHVVTAESCPQLHTVFEECLQRLDYHPKSPPRLVVYEQHEGKPQAAFWPTPPTFFLSRAAAESLHERAAQYVLGHELGHGIQSRRQFLRQGGSGFVAWMLASGLDKLGMLSGNDQTKEIETYALVALVGYALYMGESRRSEYEADQYGMDVARDPQILREVLTAFRAHDKHEPRTSISENAIMGCIELIGDIGIKVWNQQIPPDRYRIAAAERYAKKKGYIKNDGERER